jgi:hypothetical protein
MLQRNPKFSLSIAEKENEKEKETHRFRRFGSSFPSTSLQTENVHLLPLLCSRSSCRKEMFRRGELPFAWRSAKLSQWANRKKKTQKKREREYIVANHEKPNAIGSSSVSLGVDLRLWTCTKKKVRRALLTKKKKNHALSATARTSLPTCMGAS